MKKFKNKLKNKNLLKQMSGQTKLKFYNNNVTKIFINVYYFIYIVIIIPKFRLNCKILILLNSMENTNTYINFNNVLIIKFSFI